MHQTLRTDTAAAARGGNDGEMTGMEGLHGVAGEMIDLKLWLVKLISASFTAHKGLVEVVLPSFFISLLFLLFYYFC